MPRGGKYKYGKGICARCGVGKAQTQMVQGKPRQGPCKACQRFYEDDWRQRNMEHFLAKQREYSRKRYVRRVPEDYWHTDKKISQIIQMQKQGLTYTEIGQRFDLTRNAVAGILNRARKKENA